jgi:hypothetical protein
MNIILYVKKEFDIKYMSVDVEIASFRDFNMTHPIVNGKLDVDFLKTGGIGTPSMPCFFKVKESPETKTKCDHYRWRPIIDIEKGRITNWETGTKAKVCYHVNNGNYSFHDKNMKCITVIRNTKVPDMLKINGFGERETIEFDVDEKGKIKGFTSSKKEIKNMFGTILNEKNCDEYMDYYKYHL